MDPQIRYAKTSDGVSIAYWVMGQGPALILMKSAMISHVQGEWQNAEDRAWLQRLTRSFTVVSYDGRGSGLSDRDAIDFSIEAQLRDLEAILAELALDRVALFAEFFAGSVAITHAARHPDADLRLILWHSVARPADYIRSAQGDALEALLERDWDLFIQTFAYSRRGWQAGPAAQGFAELLRMSTTPKAMKAAVRQWREPEYDTSALLHLVTAETLVVQGRNYVPSSGVVRGQAAMVDMAKELASGIPNASLLLLEGDTGSPSAGYVEDLARALEVFLGVEPLEPTASAPESEKADAGLTTREAEVLRLVANGESNKEIATSLDLSVHTVERHLSNIYGKIDARGRADATAWALRNGLA